MALNTPRGSERTLGQLVSDASADLSNIVKGEIDLAKIEIKADVQKAGKGGGMLAAAGVVALFFVGFLLTAFAWAISEVLDWPNWAGFLIVAGILALVAGILALVGIKSIKKVKGKPVKTIDNAQKTVAAIKPAK
ncbi:phage holin family protein [Dermacoccus abyssi]|uniref:phage holin family protein n=1 Tax=Dermacoccus abyssi TaxID=322596 RepID=UPI002AD52C48|nr:phage holin family protein [Dermacoccus abyssi]